MTHVHDSLEEHRVTPALRIWPSVIGVSALAFVHVVAFWMGNIVAFGQAEDLQGTAYGQPAFVWGSMLAALLLVPWVAYDFRRHNQSFWRVSRYVIGGMMLVVLAALIRLLWSASTLL